MRMSGLTRRDNQTTCDGSASLSGDPDIAGLGVLISFCLACALTTVLTWPFFAKLPWGEYFLTRFDVFVWRAAQRHGQFLETEWDEKAEIAENRHRDLLLALSDTQLLASIAMMIAAASKPDISVYHISIISNLVWMASGTHLTALAYTAHRLARYPAIRRARIVALLTMAALLMFLVIVQGTESIYESPGTPVHCFLPVKPGNVGGDNARRMVFYLGLIIFNFAFTAAKLFPTLQEASSSYLERFNGALFRSMTSLVLRPLQILSPDYWRTQGRIRGSLRMISDISLSIVLWVPLSLILYILRLLCLLAYEFLWGMVVSLITDFIWFYIGIFDIVTDKEWAKPHMSEEEYNAELSWGFGQVVALLLAVAPVWSMWLARTRAYPSNFTERFFELTRNSEAKYDEAAKLRKDVLPAPCSAR